METELESLGVAIEEATRGIAQFERLRSNPNESPAASADATLVVLRAQLGALRAIRMALTELDSRLADYTEPTIEA